jgi:hypothetical protein
VLSQGAVLYRDAFEIVMIKIERGGERVLVIKLAPAADERRVEQFPRLYAAG